MALLDGQPTSGGALDPKAAAIMQAGFALMAASGPSRMPITLGAALGQAGQAGMAAYQKADEQQQLQKQRAMQQAKAENEAQMQKALMSGLLSGTQGDPDRMEAVGIKLAASGHPGGAAFVQLAEKTRAKRAEAVEFEAFKSKPGVQNFPEEGGDQGQQGGLFRTLVNSPFVGQEAKAAQERLDKSKTGDPAPYRREHERLTVKHLEGTRAREAAEDRKALLGQRPERPVQTITNDEGLVFERGGDGKWKPAVGPDGNQLKAKGTSTEKALPVGAAQRMFDNQLNLRRAEMALALVEGKNVGEMEGDKAATGWKGFVPDAALQRLDPKGIDARASLADLGSLIIHERSGAAVTAAEFPRLQPFIPSPKDDPATVQKKLRRFVQIYREVAGSQTEFYRESGYKVPEIKSLIPAKADPASPGEPELRQKLRDKYKISDAGEFVAPTRGAPGGRLGGGSRAEA